MCCLCVVAAAAVLNSLAVPDAGALAVALRRRQWEQRVERRNMWTLRPPPYTLLPDCMFVQFFRFERFDIDRLLAALRLPDFVSSGRRHVPALRCLLIVLRRLAYPCRWCELEDLFHMDTPAMSSVYNLVLSWLSRAFATTLLFDHARLTPAALARLATAAQAATWITPGGCPLPVAGFIDGTERATCRPGVHQELVYNGHKHFHAFGFQSVVSIDGMTISIAGPYPGSRHDQYMLRESGMMDVFRQCFVTADGGHPLFVYGDKGYMAAYNLLTPHKAAALTPAQQAFNVHMCSYRICVEWSFAHTVSLFAFLDFRKQQKIRLQQVGAAYLVGVLLANCHSCLYGNETSDVFRCAPPELEAYLQSFVNPA